MSIVITGTPGSGKHTVSKEVAIKTGLTIVDITSIAIDSGHVEKNHGINEVDVTKLEDFLVDKISEKNLVVGHLAPYVLTKKCVKKIIILRRNPYDLIAVYKDRGYSEGKIKENIGSEVLGTIVYDTINKFQEKAVQIDVSRRTVNDTVNEIIKIIFGNKESEEVDWLALVTKNNDLKKFFDD